MDLRILPRVGLTICPGRIPPLAQLLLEMGTPRQHKRV